MIQQSLNPLCVTIDLEDHRLVKDLKTQRYEMNTIRILRWLKEQDIKATFFVVGKIAENSPKILKQVKQEGHEIGFHSYNHLPLNKTNPKDFAKDSKRGKQLIEDITGAEMIGFRAPCFSLTRETIWATEILADLGFKYSSSVVPMKILGYGFPGVPEKIFRWRSGLVEFPMVLNKFCGIKFPALGGLYLRYIPSSFLCKTIQNSGTRWTYFHPQDIDVDISFERSEHLSLFASFFYSLNKKYTFPRLEKLIESHKITNLLDVFENLNEMEITKIRY